MSNEHDEEQFKGRLDFAIWRKLIRFLKPYRMSVSLLLVTAILVVGVDVVAPILQGQVIARAGGENGMTDVWNYLIGFAGALLLLVMCIFMFICLAGRIACGVSADIRRAAFRKLQSLQFGYYDKRNVGWLMSRLTSDCNSLSRVFSWGLLDVTWGVTLLLAMSGAMFWLNWKLAIIVCTIAPVLLAVSWWFQIRLLKTSRVIRKTNSLMTGSYNESIQGVRTTKSLGREERNLTEFQVLSDQIKRNAVRNATYSAVFIPLVGTICMVGIALALWRGGYFVSIGAIELGVAMTFLIFAQQIAGPAQELANTFAMIQNAGANAERIVGLLDEEVTIKDSPEVLSKDESLVPKSIETIEFRHVTFGYASDKPVLHDFSLTVHPGQTIALVGATGGGKSTIVSLVCRFYEPTRGQILINGIDYRELPLQWLQSSLGMVLQQPHLFSGTVRDNIRYGRLNASDAEVEEAARLTNAHEFISKLKDGYDSQVGEGGNQLSTGQKQLIALARAVIADPKIFVMDEATSSVDTQTERDIQTAVERVLEGRIAFVIAHRLSTIKNADLILVIDQGKVFEKGSHHDLIQLRGRYYELYTNQFVHEREEELMKA